jgi:hypothetical protein
MLVTVTKSKNEFIFCLDFLLIFCYNENAHFESITFHHIYTLDPFSMSSSNWNMWSETLEYDHKKRSMKQKYVDLPLLLC